MKRFIIQTLYLKNRLINLIRNIQITSWKSSIKHNSDENVPEAQHTTDGVDYVILRSTVVRDKDGAEILNIFSVI